MLVLFETPAGYALFKVLDEKKLDEVEVGLGCQGAGVYLTRGRARRPLCSCSCSWTPLLGQ